MRLTTPASVSLENLVVRLNGTNVTGLFQAVSPGNALGMVIGLTPGRNVLEAQQISSTEPAAQLVMTNYPRTGPVFSGPHEQPFICGTAQFRLPDESLLGEPLDENCSSHTVVNWMYRSTVAAGAKPSPLLPLRDTTQYPPDLEWTTNSLGRRVPYIVRVETGTINRAIYQIAVLHDVVSEAAPNFARALKGWNGRLLFSFGGGCTGGWFTQGRMLGISVHASTPGSVTDFILRNGYASVTSSLNVFGNNCQDLTASETMMMVRERFIEEFGPPLFTFGRGGSGGAYQQIQIAANYPGLLDGIIPSATFPDVLATIQFLVDTRLLDNYFSSQAGLHLSDVQKLAVSGVGSLNTVSRISAGVGRINPTSFCPPELPLPQRYDPLTNPTGARCDVFDHTVNVYGRDEAGYARRPVDNVGVQYGLRALNTGVITMAEFLDLNERIGGFDRDGRLVPTRSVADRAALRAAYATGRLTAGGGGLSKIPILDLRRYLDLEPGGDIHVSYHSYEFRDRLRRANGNVSNEVMLLFGAGISRNMEEFTIGRMDEWLTRLQADTSEAPVSDRIVRAKPPDLQDACYAPSGVPILEPQEFGRGECSRIYPAFRSPRMVAGSPLSNDILKCRLKPVDRADYRIPVADADLARLRAIFPDGVCNWNQPGVEQVPLAGTWLTF